jgi:hypothetical protein
MMNASYVEGYCCGCREEDGKVSSSLKGFLINRDQTLECSVASSDLHKRARWANSLFVTLTARFIKILVN